MTFPMRLRRAGGIPSEMIGVIVGTIVAAVVIVVVVCAVICANKTQRLPLQCKKNMAVCTRSDTSATGLRAEAKVAGK